MHRPVGNLSPWQSPNRWSLPRERLQPGPKPGPALEREQVDLAPLRDRRAGHWTDLAGMDVGSGRGEGGIHVTVSGGVLLSTSSFLVATSSGRAKQQCYLRGAILKQAAKLLGEGVRF